MDLALEQLQFLTLTDILKESISIPKQSPKTFYLMTLTLIFPLSFAVLVHSLFTHPILDQIQNPTPARHVEACRGLVAEILPCYMEIIGGVFGAVVVHGGENYGVFVRIVVGGFSVAVLAIVNLVGLLVQSVFYYVCKSFHHQGIDKSALHDHLGGYLGEYVPLKSNVQMESFDI